MEALQVEDGDLVLGKGVFATVTGPAKVSQDIEFAVLTPYGSDRFHPRYGSVFSSYIGNPEPGITQALIQGELTRVISNYQRVQLWKVQQAANSGLSSPYGQNELVASIGPTSVVQQLDSYQVTASVNTTSGEAVNVSTTVTP